MPELHRKDLCTYRYWPLSSHLFFRVFFVMTKSMEKDFKKEFTKQQERHNNWKGKETRWVYIIPTVLTGCSSSAVLLGAGCWLARLFLCCCWCPPPPFPPLPRPWALGGPLLAYGMRLAWGMCHCAWLCTNHQIRIQVNRCQIIFKHK
jgi:hypothetical protein